MKSQLSVPHLGKSVAIVSPGLLPVPPILGGSVETVIHEMAKVTKTVFDVAIYSSAHRKLAVTETGDNPSHFRFASKDSKKYFESVRSTLRKQKPSLIQVENRPLFIPRTKPLVPNSKFILSLHSLIHIEEHLIRRHFTEKIFNQCEKVLVYSQFICNRLSEMFPSVSSKFHDIHLATDPRLFTPRWKPQVEQKIRLLKEKHKIPEKCKIVLFAGRLIPIKGVHVLIKAMEEVIKGFADCCLVIVGGSWFGNRQISPYIKELQNQSSLIKNSIRFTNYVNPAELPVYFALADVLVCPSQWDEPFGLVNVEAMASGVPVVASARGGIPEIVVNGDNGFLVEDETNPSAFAKAILPLLKDSDLARTLGVNGRLAVENYFNWDRAGKQLVNFYEQVLSH